MEKIEVIAVDIETTGLNFLQDEIILISAYSDEVELVTEEIAELKSILEDTHILKVFHNSAFDVSFLDEYGINVNNYTDTLVMAQVVENKARGDGRSLEYLSEKYLGVYIDKSLQKNFSVMGTKITEDQKEYALKDAKVTFWLYQKFMSIVSEENLEQVLEREVAALPIIIYLKVNGIRFDYDGWEKKLDKMALEATCLEEKIRLIAANPELNLQSPKQLLEMLREKGIGVTATNDQQLKKHEDEHEVVALIREFKKKKKNLTAFGANLAEKIGIDGRLRGNWSLIGTDTFRMGCSSPPLQAMPRASRPYFKAEEGHSFILADYKTVELRILAAITEDRGLLKTFEDREDLHIKTAASIFQQETEVITEIERNVGKIINFGIVYGMSSFGIQKKVSSSTGENISLIEAERYRQTYFNLYPNVLDYQNAMLSAFYIRTLGGRVWRSLDKGSVQRYNYPVQGAMAEGLKEALILLLGVLEENPSWRVVNIIHDEIILEILDCEVERAKGALENVMIEGMEKIVGNIVPIKVDIAVRKSWE